MSATPLLFVAAMLVLAVYFYLFQKTVRLLSESELERFTREAGTSPWRALVPFGVAFAIVFIDSTAIRVAIVVAMFSELGWATLRQHQRIRALAFDRSFERQLLRISALSPCGITLLFSALWML